MKYFRFDLSSVISVITIYRRKLFTKRISDLAPGCAAFFAVLLTSTAALALTQPNGATIPSQMGCAGSDPTGLAAVFACSCVEDDACNIGAPWTVEDEPPPMPSNTCETTLFHNYNDNTCIPENHTGLDPWAEAATEPETFYPSETVTFTVVSRGTAMFKNIFGWYNVTGSAPAASDLHVILDCNAIAGDFVTVDIKTDPAWTGGKIGFFLITPESHITGSTCDSSDCCATVGRFQAGVGYAYYSQSAFNPDDYPGGGASYIHLLIYQSHIDSSKFYFAWEDTYGAPNNDFTDLVTSVEGVGTKKTGSYIQGILAWLARPKKEGGCHSDVAGSGLGGGLILALTAAGLGRRRRS